MSWTDQDPPAENVLFQGYILRNGDHVHVEIDKLVGGEYRATAGNLFGSQEIVRNRDIEWVLRAIQGLGDK